MKNEFNLQRRNTLRAGGGIGLFALLTAVGLLRPFDVLAESNRDAFSAKNLDEALTAMGVKTQESNDVFIQLTVPEIAENGAIVPVKVISTYPKVERISILVEKNPNVLAANFIFPQGTEPMLTTRVKMGQTCNVIALVKADGKYYRSAKEVKVTAGGCGG